MQERRHALDHHVADEASQDENVEFEDEHLETSVECRVASGPPLYFRIIFPRISSDGFQSNVPSFTCGLTSS
ncbi:hypothetical protein D3C83_171100 [compost metagenome]